jgi:hypothetical protein
MCITSTGHECSGAVASAKEISESDPNSSSCSSFGRDVLKTASLIDSKVNDYRALDHRAQYATIGEFQRARSENEHPRRVRRLP